MIANLGLDLRRVAGALGAEIHGVDLSQDLRDRTIAEIRAALVEHQVVFFRDQTLSPEQQVRFGRRFGRLNIHPYVAGMDGHPEVMEVVKEPGDKLN
ncbi:MAG: taurine dioxygenase, partial [Caulobacteraceae bacterium]|nr:taurine dioxygenase [Caulobacteraceae bacterium]